MTREELDTEAGLTSGHSGKLFGRPRREQIRQRHARQSARRLGLVIVVAIDPDEHHGPPIRAAPTTAASRSTGARPAIRLGPKAAAIRALKLRPGSAPPAPEPPRSHAGKAATLGSENLAETARSVTRSRYFDPVLTPRVTTTKCPGRAFHDLGTQNTDLSSSVPWNVPSVPHHEKTQIVLTGHAVPLERGRPKGRHQVCLFGSVPFQLLPYRGTQRLPACR